MMRIAVIGAGLAGLVVARRLGDSGEVTVFEKSRGVGGRMATRYADDFEFDHGAQFFTARTPEFRAFLEPLINAGVVADWPARFVELSGSTVTASRQWGASHPHYVGVPRMNEVGKFLARGLEIRLKTAVSRIEKSAGGWQLLGTAGDDLGCFDWLVLATPAPQAAHLAADVPGFAAAACGQSSMRACFALLLGFDKPLDLGWQAALVRDADISWISVNSSKPGRTGLTALVVHSTNAWADAHLEEDTERLQQHLVDELGRVLGRDVSTATYCDLHRWRYANLDRTRGPEFFLERDSRLAACGDWYIRGRVEAAFTSAFELAGVFQEELAT